eukprot:816585-Prorocentrum_minimum.AAC.2
MRASTKVCLKRSLSGCERAHLCTCAFEAQRRREGAHLGGVPDDEGLVAPPPRRVEGERHHHDGKHADERQALRSSNQPQPAAVLPEPRCGFRATNRTTVTENIPYGRPIERHRLRIFPMGDQSNVID